MLISGFAASIYHVSGDYLAGERDVACAHLLVKRNILEGPDGNIRITSQIKIA
jgi:hypothetical protein